MAYELKNDTQQTKPFRAKTAEPSCGEASSPVGFWDKQSEQANSQFEDPTHFQKGPFNPASKGRGKVSVSSAEPQKPTPIPDVEIWRDDNLAASGNHPNFSKQYHKD